MLFMHACKVPAGAARFEANPRFVSSIVRVATILPTGLQAGYLARAE
jgi:hypothetical protein